MNFSVRLVVASLFLFLLFPVIVMIFKLGGIGALSWEEVLPSLSYTLQQATLSTVFAMIIGLLGSSGLCAYQGQAIYKYLEILFLLPNFLPALFIIASVLNIWNYIGPFPFGLWGIVVIHGLINGGLVAVFLARLLRSSVGSLCELALVEGCSKWKFWWVGVLGGLKGQVYLLAFFVFALCFNSFSVPLIVGDLRNPVLEVLIYEKVRSSETWGQALSLSGIQILVLFIFGILGRSPEAQESKRIYNMELLSGKLWAWLVGVISLLILSGNLSGVLEGFNEVLEMPGLSTLIGSGILGSFLVGLSVGSFVVFLLVAVAWCFPSPSFQRFLLSYGAPSSVITGFSLLLLPPFGTELWIEVLKMAVGISLILFPSCYRLRAEGVLSEISGQLILANSMGASRWLMFAQVMWPQVRPTFFALGGLAAFWACGEFAISSIIASSDVTLALMIKSFLGSYRMELATFLLWPMMTVGVVCWFIFEGAGRVLGQKS